MRMNLREKIFDEKLKTNMELIRRRLDFEVIKDNYENKVTQEILDKYADLDQGLPGTNFKYQKIQQLAKERRTLKDSLRSERRRRTIERN